MLMFVKTEFSCLTTWMEPLNAQVFFSQLWVYVIRAELAGVSTRVYVFLPNKLTQICHKIDVKFGMTGIKNITPSKPERNTRGRTARLTSELERIIQVSGMLCSPYNLMNVEIDC